ncbi:PEP-CTERM sorting domain-containing protein [Almyronema epifaneia]|uniref:PEP-CTERM sorting domain-containing protein n=1 Tax=Almyronema epifaneia S1 TaxID=2991925 RepID=A0ABW6IKZ9_9CYAN
MKHIVLAATAALGLAALAAPAEAALFSWNVEYTGWWEEEATVSGTLFADEASAADGILSLDELTDWSWSWSGNSFVPAFAISSKDEGAEIQIFDPSAASGFYVDGTANLPDLLDDLDQGVFAAGDFLLDLEFLIVEQIDTGSQGTSDSLVAFGDTSAAGTVSVADPKPVPEPAALLGLLALSGLGTASLKRQKQAA